MGHRWHFLVLFRVKDQFVVYAMNHLLLDIISFFFFTTHENTITCCRRDDRDKNRDFMDVDKARKADHFGKIYSDVDGTLKCRWVRHQDRRLTWIEISFVKTSFITLAKTSVNPDCEILPLAWDLNWVRSAGGSSNWVIGPTYLARRFMENKSERSIRSGWGHTRPEKTRRRLSESLVCRSRLNLIRL